MNYNTMASEEVLNKTVQNLISNNFQAEILDTKADALEKIKELIPSGASVMNGASVTLDQIGFIDYLKADSHGWNNIHEKIIAETDPLKKVELRKSGVLSDFYLGSVHAITENGEIVVASNTGSQMPHIVFTSPNVILVVGTQKITPSIIDALNRIEEYVVPLEDKRMKKAYGYGTMHSKTVILHKENAVMQRKVHVLFVKEELGF